MGLIPGHLNPETPRILRVFWVGMNTKNSDPPVTKLTSGMNQTEGTLTPRILGYSFSGGHRAPKSRQGKQTQKTGLRMNEHSDPQFPVLLTLVTFSSSKCYGAHYQDRPKSSVRNCQSICGELAITTVATKRQQPQRRLGKPESRFADLGDRLELENAMSPITRTDKSRRCRNCQSICQELAQFSHNPVATKRQQSQRRLDKPESRFADLG